MRTKPQTGGEARAQYQRKMLEVRGAFEAGASGSLTVASRSAALDQMVREFWHGEQERRPEGVAGVAVVAVGGYGRGELFPYSDVDLMFLLDGRVADESLKDAIRRVNQELWDSGARVSPATRKLGECERFDPENAEFTISLLDHRLVAGDETVYSRMAKHTIPKLLQKEHKALLNKVAEMTRDRHAKYGGTLFHLEPNIKECPGGLRDVNVCAWMSRLQAISGKTEHRNGISELDKAGEFEGAVEFLQLVRCFLHFRHERDDNTLDWLAQDAAAEGMIGIEAQEGVRVRHKADAAYWMRAYFRHARIVERHVSQLLDDAPERTAASKLLGWGRGRKKETPDDGFRLERGRIELDAPGAGKLDPAHDPEVVLKAFAAVARTGARLARASEARLSQALPLLSAHLEEGPALWQRLKEILTKPYAGDALRSMHAMGLLELILPEFHGIDALVIRDAYHRYTVDEHTFVLIDTLHGLESPPPGGMAEWATRFGAILRELPHSELLFLVALLHDTGKGRKTGDHAAASVKMARNVMERLELDGYERGLVESVIANHLEMSAALRRDIFDAETVRGFAAKVPAPEALRMLTLFTYADIQAVHPDALTPWKAENLWRLYIATSNFLDRSVDDERVGARQARELVDRVAAVLPGQRNEVAEYLEGFPERYVLTRTPEQVRGHFGMTRGFAEDPVRIEFHYAPGVSELTLVTPDRRLLFANMAGVLAAWGMNIVTAEAFSNRQGVVVDSFRFTDTFRTLEMNQSEHERFVRSVHDVMAGRESLERLLSGRRRARRKAALVEIESRVDFDNEASSHSTLVEVIAQDTPGLLRALSLTLAEHSCNIEVALVDTEGEMAIDVFYVTREGVKLEAAEREKLRLALLKAMEENAR